MDLTVRGLSFTVVGVMAGLLLLALGLSDGIALGEYALAISYAPFRLASITAGLVILGAAFTLEWFGRMKHKPGSATPPSATSTAPVADDFFMTLDHGRSATFPEMAKGSRRVQMLARTVVNLVGLYGRTISELAAGGCRVEILVVDPASESARFLYGSNYELYRSNADSALRNLAHLKRLHPDKITVKFFPFVPTMSVLIFEKNDQSFLQVQLYFIHAALGRDRPLFTIHPSDRWYTVFCEEFSILWDTSAEADLSQYNVVK